MVDEEDEVTGETYVVDLAEIPLIEAGQFDNVQSDPSLQHFIRDHLLEPDYVQRHSKNTFAMR